MSVEDDNFGTDDDESSDKMKILGGNCMKKMNMEKIFGGFCLSERKFVESLEKGAREFGGATKIDNEIFSN